MPVRIPEILNTIARAGAKGIAVPYESLELCRSWGIDFARAGDRITLAFDKDRLIPAWIEDESRFSVEGFFEIESTNDEAVRRAREGAPAGLLIFSETQTAGKGRLGRKWVSRPHQGLYFSLMLRPGQDLSCWPLLTYVASVALANAVGEFVPPPLVDLKWPNDVLLSGKKTAGILLETLTAGGNHAAIIGVGVNVGFESVPEELRDHATSVSTVAGASVPRRSLLVRFLAELMPVYDLFERGEHTQILEEWKRHSSMWNGAPVWIVEGQRRRAAVTCGLTSAGALRVKIENGAEETVLAADVSLRRM